MGAKRPRLHAHDTAAIIDDCCTATRIRDICTHHQIGLATLYRLLDDRHIERRRPDNSLRTPAPIQDRIAVAYQAGVPVRQIAETHGVSYSNVSNVGRRRYRQRMHVRAHNELIEIIMRWFTGHPVTETEIDAISRVGVRTRNGGLAAFDHIDPALWPHLAASLVDAIKDQRSVRPSEVRP